MHHKHVGREEFERLVQDAVDPVVTADSHHQYLTVHGVTYIARLPKANEQ